MSTLFGPSDVQARLSADAYLRAFDLNSAGSVNPTDVQRACDAAESQFRMWVKAAFPVLVPPIDDLVVQRLVGLACYMACEFYPGRGGSNSYQAAYDVAKELAKNLSQDNNARFDMNTAGPPQPRPTVLNTTNAAGLPTNPFGRAADGTDSSNF